MTWWAVIGYIQVSLFVIGLRHDKWLSTGSDFLDRGMFLLEAEQQLRSHESHLQKRKGLRLPMERWFLLLKQPSCCNLSQAIASYRKLSQAVDFRTKPSDTEGRGSKIDKKYYLNGPQPHLFTPRCGFYNVSCTVLTN